MEESEEETVFFSCKEFAIQMVNCKILSQFQGAGKKISNENRVVVDAVFEELDYFIPWHEKSPQIQKDKQNLRNDYTRLKMQMLSNQKKGLEMFEGLSDEPFISSKRFPALFRINKDR